MWGSNGHVDLTGLFWRRFKAMMSDQRTESFRQHGECAARGRSFAGARGRQAVAVGNVFLVRTIPNKTTVRV
jgi:hypothetical protein